MIKRVIFLLLGFGLLGVSRLYAQPQIGLRIAPCFNLDRYSTKILVISNTTERYSNLMLSGGVFLITGRPKGFRFLTELEYQPKRIYENNKVGTDVLGAPQFGEKLLSRALHYGVVGVGTRYHTPQLFKTVRVFADAALRGNIMFADDGDLKLQDDPLRDWTMSFRLGVGMQFRIKKRLALFWDIKYDRDLVKAAKAGISLFGIGLEESHRLRTYSLGIGIAF